MEKDFAASELWGWKNPRNCLTLPFWQRFLPPMRYLICLRNPLDVAASLERRDGFSLEKSVDLWLTYVMSAVQHTAGRPRLFVFYEDVMDDWQESLNAWPGLWEGPGTVNVSEAPLQSSSIRNSSITVAH